MFIDEKAEGRAIFLVIFGDGTGEITQLINLRQEMIEKNLRLLISLRQYDTGVGVSVKRGLLFR